MNRLCHFIALARTKYNSGCPRIHTLGSLPANELQRGGESWEFLLLEHSMELGCDVVHRTILTVEFVHGAQLLPIAIFHDVRVWLGFDLVELHGCGSLSGGGGGGGGGGLLLGCYVLGLPFGGGLYIVGV